MGFVCLLCAVTLLALGLLPFLEPGKEDDAIERPALVTLLAFALLIGSNWALAFAGLLTAAALWTCTILYALAGAWLLHARRRPAAGPVPWGRQPMVLLATACILVVVLYVVVRGTVLPIAEFDALSYHFPRAVEVLRSHTVPHIPAGDFRVAYFPWNYELLLADALLLTPGDGLAHLIGLPAAFGFCATAYAMFRRAWPALSSADAFFGVVFVLATPVLIMHLADFKNDVLFAFFLLSFVHRAARWGQLGSQWDLALASLSLGLAFGTKSNALFLLPTVLGVLIWFRHRFRLPAKQDFGRLAGWAAGLLALLVLTGSAWPLLNQAWCGHPLGDVARVGGVDGFESCTVPRYTGVSNLWRFPLLAVLRPFYLNAQDIWVFWRDEWWWWPRNRSLYSHFGWLCSALLLLIPFGWLRHRQDQGSTSTFRVIVSASMLGFILCCLPQQYRLDGAFCALPRALLCIPVLVALWTLAPLLARVRESRRRLLTVAMALGLLGYFAGQAFTYLKNDETKGFRLFAWFLLNPNQSDQQDLYGAFDRVAGPTDPVAFDGGFGCFFYPLYGKNYTRPLHFVRHQPGPLLIPRESKWVVIDRSWNVGWSHPGVTSTADFKKPLKRAPSAEDKALFRQLTTDPEWALVIINTVQNQAVFLRRSELPPGQQAPDLRAYYRAFD